MLDLYCWWRIVLGILLAYWIIKCISWSKMAVEFIFIACHFNCINVDCSFPSTISLIEDFCIVLQWNWLREAKGDLIAMLLSSSIDPKCLGIFRCWKLFKPENASKSLKSLELPIKSMKMVDVLSYFLNRCDLRLKFKKLQWSQSKVKRLLKWKRNSYYLIYFRNFCGMLSYYYICRYFFLSAAAHSLCHKILLCGMMCFFVVVSLLSRGKY